MDIVINSNVQSPLVRTLSATQGKSASFTHHIKDNVPPVSFTKIVLTPDGGATGTYNRNYKFKIPQYGYLRNFILKFSASENGIGTSIMADIYNQCNNTTLGSRTNGNWVGYYGSSTAKGVTYDLRELFGSRRTIGNATGSAGGASAVAVNSQVFVPNGFVPPFEGLVRNGNMDPWASMWLRIRGGSNYNYFSDTTDTATKIGDARIFPYRYVPRYDALNAFGRNTFSQKLTGSGTTGATTGASGTNGYYEEGVTFTVTAATSAALLFEMANWDWSVAVPNDGIEWHGIDSVTTSLHSLVSDNNATYFGSSETAVSQSGIIGGALPSFTTGTGTCPNVQLRNRYLGQRLQSTYDWCSQANLSKHLGALMPVTVTLSTHNRVIQTIYPSETLARIYRMPQDKKRRYLAMLRPSITSSPSSVYQNTFAFGDGDLTAGPVTSGVSYLRSALTGTTYDTTGATGTYRQWDCYFPCFFSFFEDPSMNLDTRFVENLEIDCLLNPSTNIYAPEDLGNNTANLGTPAAASAGTNGTNLSIATINSRSTLTAYNGWHSSEFRQRVVIINTAVSVTALAYYHNFHDSTSQAIRDSNFKPNVPANVLGYNTYSESPVLITAQTLAQGGVVNINLSCNNLTQELVFLVRRRQRNIATNPSQTKQAFEDFFTTLPVKSITLTGSGQQLYAGTGAECLLTDQWDFPLSSVETGTYNTNDTGIFGDNHASMYAQSKPKSDGFFAYRIPFSFSADKTYNSGVIALQTINNPVLSIQFYPLVGWVVNDDQLAAERPSVFNLDENYGTSIGIQTVFDNDFQIEVYENYWQLIRIDSNTGAVTKSLDL